MKNIIKQIANNALRTFLPPCRERRGGSWAGVGLLTLLMLAMSPQRMWADKCSKCTDGMATCNKCSGNGWISISDDCSTCRGTGIIVTSYDGENETYESCGSCQGAGSFQHEDECPTCKGPGKVTCTTCNGTSLVPHAHTPLTAHPAVATSYSAAGNTVYWSCSQCSKYFSDAEGKKVIEENSWVIAPLKSPFDVTVTQANNKWKMEAAKSVTITKEDDGYKVSAQNNSTNNYCSIQHGECAHIAITPQVTLMPGDDDLEGDIVARVKRRASQQQPIALTGPALVLEGATGSPFYLNNEHPSLTLTMTDEGRYVVNGTVVQGTVTDIYFIDPHTPQNNQCTQCSDYTDVTVTTGSIITYHTCLKDALYAATAASTITVPLGNIVENTNTSSGASPYISANYTFTASHPKAMIMVNNLATQKDETGTGTLTTVMSPRTDYSINVYNNYEQETMNDVVLTITMRECYQLDDYRFVNAHQNITDESYTLTFDYTNHGFDTVKDSGKDVTLNYDGTIKLYTDGEGKYVVAPVTEGVEILAPESCDALFREYYHLASLTFNNFNTGKVTSMTYMFSNCTSLKSLDLSSFNTSQVTDMSNMFSGCTSLKSLDLSSFNTSKVTDMPYMFSGCTSLKSLTIGNFSMVGVNDTYMFDECNALDTLTLKAIPYLEKDAFDGQFHGESKTVRYQLDDNSLVTNAFMPYLPAPTTLPTYTRTMDEEWGTLVLPFPFDIDSENQHCDFYQLTLEGSVLRMTKMTGCVEISTPVVIRMRESAKNATTGKYELNLTASELQLNLDVINKADLGSDTYFRGSYQTVDLSGNSTIYLLQNDQFVKAHDASNPTITPFRAYVYNYGANIDTYALATKTSTQGDATLYTYVQQDGTKLDQLGTAAFSVTEGTATTLEFVDGMAVMKCGNNKVAELPMSDNGQLVIDFHTLLDDDQLGKVSKTVSAVGMATLYSPFQLQVPAEGDVEVYAPTYDESTHQLMLTSNTKVNGEVIPAGTGLMLKNAGDADFTITQATPTYTTQSSLTGSALKIANPTKDGAVDGKTVYTLGMESTSQELGFFAYTGQYLNPALAFLYVSTVDAPNEAKAIGLAFEDDDATGIGELRDESLELRDADAIYNLQGQKLAAPRKGVNIINGKKVLVK